MTNPCESRDKSFKILFTLSVFCLLVGVASSQPGEHCNSPDEFSGTCVELKSCENIFKLRHKVPQTHTDRLYVSLSLCGFQNFQPLVCCTGSSYPLRALSESAGQQLSITPATQRPSTIWTRPPPVQIMQGVQPRSYECAGVIDNRIYGGSETKINEMPFTAIIAYFKALGSSVGEKNFFCGGGLISESSVITAAHCVHDEVLRQRRWKLRGVRLGEWNTETNPDCDNFAVGGPVCAPPAVDLAVALKIVHPDFIPFSVGLNNDIAILKLREAVQFNDYVRPICLPRATSSRSDFSDVPLIVAGFGRTETSDSSRVKLKTEVRGVTNAACKEFYANEQQKINENQICALGEDGHDSCNGDSGQPLLHVNTETMPAHWELVGIVSFGPSPCGQQSKPGVYTKISNYLEWILKNMS